MCMYVSTDKITNSIPLADNHDQGRIQDFEKGGGPGPIGGSVGPPPAIFWKFNMSKTSFWASKGGGVRTPFLFGISLPAGVVV